MNALLGMPPGGRGSEQGTGGQAGRQSTEGTYTGVFLIQVSIVIFQDVVRVANLFPDIHGLSGGRAARVITTGTSPSPAAGSAPCCVSKGIMEKFPPTACRTRHVKWFSV